MRISKAPRYDTGIVAICTFLTCYAAQPVECSCADEVFLERFEALDLAEF